MIALAFAEKGKAEKDNTKRGSLTHKRKHTVWGGVL